MAETLIILRNQTSVPNGDLELFIGNSCKGEVFIISLDKQLDWLGLIVNSMRNSAKRNA